MSFIYLILTTTCSLIDDFYMYIQTFVCFMKGRYPQTIVTDLDLGLKDAIRSELPSTKHVISVSSILPRLSNWFSVPLESQFEEFRSYFDSLICMETSEDFDFRWNQMVSRFNLDSDKHITLLHSLRTYWAPSYTRCCFVAQITTLTFLKSVDAFLKGVFSEHTCLRSFFDQVGMSANFQNQSNNEMQYLHTRTCIPIEDHARAVLTPFAFNALQHELVLSMQYAVSEMVNGSYHVHHYKKMDRERIVVWVPEEEHLCCSCKEFESSGILCRHALRVFIVKNYFQLPDKYFPTRWRQESSLMFLDDQHSQDNDEWFREYQSLSENLFVESSISKERSDYVRGELMKEMRRLLNEVRNMPDNEVPSGLFLFLPHHL
ncbi:hypothetical protein SAY86_026756 [Trapa natans]|uniref:Protein FAR1-RELATED SEQUENCE n=1 Tax=Trapa natans TaxID=22666 RepID=A0AAN7KKB7_TRANT|nr:hypothetical protein SAY86_026756 [Trapa natans]